ncbi:MAG: YdcF family protein [Clostridiales bacterium]|nr:YdcF family protein [Clostridiales bacterium]
MNGKLAAWQHRVKKRYMTLILLAFILTTMTAVSMQDRDSYTLASARAEKPSRVEFSREGMAEWQVQEGRKGVTFHARQPGDVTAKVYYPGADGETVLEYQLHVDDNLGLSVGRGRFAGDRMIIFSVMTMFAAGTLVSVYTSIEAHRKKAFSYTMVAADALSLMLVFQTVFLFAALFDSADLSLAAFFAQVHAQGTRFVAYTSLIMIGLAVWLWISNVVLLWREGFSWRNMLGIGLGALWGSAYLIHALIVWSGSSSIFLMILQTIVDYTIAYFECVLFALALSGIRAAVHVPPYDRDCIVILGCQLRKNGTPTPLLRGRLDRALAFEEKQFAMTGRHAVFIPSGGRGKNEVCPEAASMAAYLEEKGVPVERILKEEGSTNTLQNMEYSMRLIREKIPGAKAAFSTTGYHVFRSLLWASRCGFECEGMGSHTKWYYYPNAYLREILGLVAAHHAVLWGLLVVVGVYLLFGLLAQVR